MRLQHAKIINGHSVVTQVEGTGDDFRDGNYEYISVEFDGVDVTDILDAYHVLDNFFDLDWYEMYRDYLYERNYDL